MIQGVTSGVVGGLIESHVRGDRRQQAGADSGHPIQRLKPAKRPPLAAISNDRFRETHPHPGQPRDFCSRRVVEVYPLPPTEGTGQCERRVAVGLSTREGGAGLQQGDLTRGFAR